MNNLRRSYDHRKNVKASRIVSRPYEMYKYLAWFLRCYYDVRTAALRRERVSCEVEQILDKTIDQSSNLRMVYERLFRTAFFSRSYEMV